MPYQNFTTIDIRGTAVASLLFLAFAFAPGYLIGWVSNVFSFRQRRISTRLLLATVLSISVSPILCYWIGWLFATRGIWVACAISSGAAAVLLIRDLREVGCRVRPALPFILIAGAWAVVVIASLIDIQLQNRLYFSPVGHDYAIRAAIAGAISRTGVRPATPFFFPGAPVPLRYHHFWLIVCSLVQQLGGKSVDTRQALFAGTVWSGIALMALVPLCLRFFCDQGSDAIGRRSLIGIGLLAVTGLDLIPTVLLMKFSGVVLADMDLWNDPIFSFPSSILWAPHHVVSLVACLTGFLLLWCAGAKRGARAPFAAIALAGCAFASAVGSSIHVSLVFAAFLGLWTLIAMVRRWHRHGLVLLSAGAVAAALAAPHLLTLIAHGAGSAAESAAFVRPWVRPIRIAAILMDASHVAPWRSTLVQALLLPLNYFLELGFFFVIGILTYKRYKTAAKLTRQQLALSVLMVTSLLISTFLRSSVIGETDTEQRVPINDLGMRGILFAQFALVLWAVELWPNWRNLAHNVRVALGIMLALGAAGSVYQVTMLRLFPMLADCGVVAMPHWLSSDRQLGPRTMAMRQAYDVLQPKLPLNAIVQNNPDVTVDDYFYGLYANRQTAVASRGCDVAFGGAIEACDAVTSRLAPLFHGATAAPPDGSLGVDALIFKDTDPVWAERNNWIWRARPLFANNFVRVILMDSPGSLPSAQ